MITENFLWLQTTGAQQLLSILNSLSHSAYFVGGCVRDSLMGLAPKDFDLASSATPEQNLKLLAQSNITVIPTGLKYGTITALINKIPYEITTLRTDVKSFGRAAETRFTSCFYLDSCRRDFTCNALYYNHNSHQVIDFHGGIADLKRGLIRFIGEAQQRIHEDYLRMLRFIRFQTHIGSYNIDCQALACIQKLAPKVKFLSKERITGELSKILGHPRAALGAKLLNKTGLAQVLFKSDLNPLNLLKLNQYLKSAGLEHSSGSLIKLYTSLSYLANRDAPQQPEGYAPSKHHSSFPENPSIFSSIASLLSPAVGKTHNKRHSNSSASLKTQGKAQPRKRDPILTSPWIRGQLSKQAPAEKKESTPCLWLNFWRLGPLHRGWTHHLQITRQERTLLTNCEVIINLLLKFLHNSTHPSPLVEDMTYFLLARYTSPVIQLATLIMLSTLKPQTNIMWINLLKRMQVTAANKKDFGLNVTGLDLIKKAPHLNNTPQVKQALTMLREYALKNNEQNRSTLLSQADKIIVNMGFRTN